MTQAAAYVNPEPAVNALFTLLAHLLPKGGVKRMAQALATIGQIQSELAARIGVIGLASTRRRADAIAVEIGQIRQIANRHGLFPAVAVSHALESALARGECGALIQGWLSILGDAIGSDRHDRAACETFAAACSVRLSS